MFQVSVGEEDKKKPSSAYKDDAVIVLFPGLLSFLFVGESSVLK